MRFEHQPRLDVGGFTWYCRVAGSLWTTDPDGSGGWEIYFDRRRKPATWMLNSPGFTVQYDTGTGKGSFKSALREAGRWIQEDYPQEKA